MSPQRLIMAVFFLQALAFGSWIPRIPDIQEKLGLSPAELALTLLGTATGTLMTLPFAGRLASAIGGRATIIYGFYAYLAAVCLPGFAWNGPMLYLALAVLGATLSIIELGMNVEADLIEKETGSAIMSRCHGFWSLGMMAGSLIGAGFAGLMLEPRWSLLIAALLSLPVCIYVSMRLPVPEVAEAGDDAADVKRFQLPGKPLLAICFFLFGVTMAEGAIADWSGVYLRDIFLTSGAATGLGYALFSMTAAGGRFIGDWMRGRFGPVKTARLCGVTLLLGLVIVLLAPLASIAFGGFALIGFGVSVGFPLGVTAAASLTDRPPAASVAILTFVAISGFMVGPPMIGFVAEYSGLREGLAMLLPPLVLSLFLTGSLRPKGRPPKHEPVVAGEIL
jgi:MFS family permease